uniref:Uncharacterized protein n=1 Tax=Pararge aegeria TaxID=116150 RepID=S4P8Y5_9NEOP
MLVACMYVRVLVRIASAGVQALSMELFSGIGFVLTSYTETSEGTFKLCFKYVLKIEPKEISSDFLTIDLAEAGEATVSDIYKCRN